MKNKYNIKFKYGLGYGGEIRALIYNLLSKNIIQKILLKTFTMSWIVLIKEHFRS